MLLSLNKLNFFVLSLCVIAYVFTFVFGIRFFSYFFSLAFLSYALAVGGINTALIIQFFLKEKFNKLELLNIAAMCGLLVMPLIYLAEMCVFGKDYRLLPIINTLFSYLGIVILENFFGQERKFYNPTIFSLKRDNLRKVWPLLLVAILFILIILSFVLVSFPFPESDPYYWRERYEFLFKPGVSLYFLDRPLFLVLARIFIGGAGIDNFAFFKYAIPGLSILLLLPAYLVARGFKGRLSQVAILFLPLISPSVLMFQMIPIPQTIATIVTFFFLFWLVYSQITNQKQFYFFAGTAIFLSVIYHEVTAIIFLMWLLWTTIFYRNNIWRFIVNNKIITFLLILVIYPHLSIIKTYVSFIFYWIGKTINAILSFDMNWRFPAFYYNIDQKAVGWPGFAGVSKYYLFYVGPGLMFAVFLFCWNNWRNHSFQKNFKRSLLRPEALLIASLVIVFFSISEVLPRLANIAMLPDRSWVFGGIFLSSAILFIFKYTNQRKNILAAVLLFFITIGIGAALYVNNQKKYVFPDYQIKAVNWIKNNLPTDRIILSAGNGNLLKYHSESLVYIMPENFYCDETLNNFDTLMKVLETQSQGLQVINPTGEKIIKEIQNYLAQAVSLDAQRLEIIANKYKNEYDHQAFIKKDHFIKPMYIFYFQDDPRNPFLQRQYYSKVVGCSIPVFESNPQEFEKIYSDQNYVIIWKVKK